MKTKYIFLILCFLGIAMGSCKDDSASNPTFADDELYIYTDMLESHSRHPHGIPYPGFSGRRQRVRQVVAGR